MIGSQKETTLRFPKEVMGHLNKQNVIRKLKPKLGHGLY